MSDMFDALIGDQPVDSAALASGLRKKEVLGTIAALTGINGLQKLGPQMINQAASGAQDYATLRDRSQNQLLQRAIAMQGQQNENTRASESLAERKQHDREMEDLRRSTQPAQPAPSYHDIIDPKDPTRLITIDGRLYTPGNSLGDPGVIGVAGKEPGKAKQDETRGTGQKAVNDTVAQLKDLYDQLDQNGDITNTDRSGSSNMVASGESSPVGQFFGRLVGTKSQSLRNQINQSRPLLLQAIKQATGMSSKQMDSNAELKFYLAAATDPTLDVQANRKALEHLDQLYGLAGAPTAVNVAPAQAGAAGPAPGGNPLETAANYSGPPGRYPANNPADNAPAIAPGTPQNAQRTVVRLGTLKGKRVAQYSDGTIGPAP